MPLNLNDVKNNADEVVKENGDLKLEIFLLRSEIDDLKEEVRELQYEINLFRDQVDELQRSG